MTLDECVAMALMVGPLKSAVERVQNAVRLYVSSKFTKAMLDYPECEPVLRALHLELLRDLESPKRRGK